MIKWIKHGKAPDSKKTDTCNKCGCKFSYDEEDLIEDKEASIKMIKCPKCGQIIIIGAGRVQL